MLLMNRLSTAEKVIGPYRAGNRVENAFRDLKHGMDRRPAGCTNGKAVKGRTPSVPGSFLHIDGEVPSSRIQVPYGGIHMRGAGPVLAYGRCRG